MTMNRKELESYIFEKYHTEAEYPWFRYPNFAVFRHRSNEKWFAVIMDLSERKLGLNSDSIIDAVNLKCDPDLIGSLRMEPGIFPAYHMDKTHWITVALDGSVPDDKLQWLLEMSHRLTASKKKQR